MMVKRPGPQRPNYDDADRSHRLRAMRLMIDEGLSANAAAWKVGPETLAGGGSIASKQSRLQRWLCKYARGSKQHIRVQEGIEQWIAVAPVRVSRGK